MSSPSDKKLVFGLSSDQVGRLLSIGSDDNEGGFLWDQDQPAQKMVSPTAQGQLACATESPLQIQGYDVLEKVAEAGQGQVWRAVQLSTRNDVAIKVPKLGSVVSDRARLRFEREVELAARLKHPNIARVYESGIDCGQHYYVMDFIDGTSLDEYVRENSLTSPQILELMQSICQAVQHAHQMGVIHRDLKPSNIIVTSEGHPYVIDFGLAKELLDDGQGPLVSMDGETIGTPAYMSPEQVQGQTDSIDTRTDVYSLGVILFGLLTGELPHDLSGTRQQVMRRIAEGEFRQPRCVCPSIDKDLELLLLKALDHDPEQRYASANDLAVDIDNFLNDRALAAGPTRVLYRVKKFIRLHRILVAAAFVISASLCASVAMYLRAQIQAQQSQAISLLLDSMLSALSPYRPQGGEVTALSVMDSVAPVLEGLFPDDPLTEAKYRSRIGMIYSSFDDQETAIQHKKRSLKIRREQLGEDDPLTVETVFALGSSYWAQGRPNKAEPLLYEAVRQRTRQLGPEHSQTLQARLILANNHGRMGEHRKTLEIALDVLACARREKGDEHKRAILATAIISRVHAELDDYAASEEWGRKARKLALQELGESHSWTAEFTYGLGAICLRQGKFSEAESFLKDGYAKTHAIFGDSYSAHWVLAYLIRTYMGWGRFDKAHDLRAELRASQIRWITSLGKESSDADASVSGRGSMHYDERSNTYTIAGGGMDVWDIFDEFHFATKTLAGDGTIQARIHPVQRIDSVQSPGFWTGAGIMMRDSVEPTSKYASVLIRPGDLIEFQCRATERGPTHSRRMCIRDMTLPHWIKLQRRGNSFTAYHASDGLNWKEIRADDPNQPASVELVINKAIHIGLAVTSADVVRTVTARISNVNTTGDVSPSGPFTESRDISLLTATTPTDESTQGTTATSSPSY
jgi:eukaryotic-like serine/threonine-protein kinase